MALTPDVDIDLSGFATKMRSANLNMRQRLMFAMNKAGEQATAYATSYSPSETQPPIRTGGTLILNTPVNPHLPRPAHPGGWADRTGDLARAIDFELFEKKSERKFRLIIGVINPEELVNNSLAEVQRYARELDQMHGYSVLAGAQLEAYKEIQEQMKFLLESGLTPPGLTPRKHGEFQFNIQWADILLG